LLSTIPFEMIFQNSTRFTKFSKFARISRLYNVVRLTRMFKLLKIFRKRSIFDAGIMSETVRFGIGIQRLPSLLSIYLICIHITACIWVFIGRFDEGYTTTWIYQGNFADYTDA